MIYARSSSSLKNACVLAAAALLAACATLRPSGPVPVLRLSPASLGRELSLVQQLEITAGGRSQRFDAVAEVDANAVRLALLQPGQTVARVEWDGTAVHMRLAHGWPQVISADQLISDFQMMWWPADAIRRALPGGWTLEQTASTRKLFHEREAVTTMQAISDGHTRIVQHLAGYTVDAYSQGDTVDFARP